MEPNTMICDTPTALRFFASAANKVEAELMRKAADEIERLRMTSEERGAVEEGADALYGKGFDYDSETLRGLLARTERPY